MVIRAFCLATLVCLGSCSTYPYNCGWDSETEPEWAPAQLAIEDEEELLLIVDDYRDRTEHLSYETRRQIYSSDIGKYLVCVPPRRDLRKYTLPGCYADRYIVDKVNRTFVVTSENSWVCT